MNLFLLYNEDYFTLLLFFSPEMTEMQLKRSRTTISADELLDLQLIIKHFFISWFSGFNVCSGSRSFSIIYSH